jgi:hypothetical protein
LAGLLQVATASSLPNSKSKTAEMLRLVASVERKSQVRTFFLRKPSENYEGEME